MPVACGAVVWAFAAAAAANISVAASVDLMTNPASPLNVRPLKHISLVANNLGVVQGWARGLLLILRARAGARARGMRAELSPRGLSLFETALRASSP